MPYSDPPVTSTPVSNSTRNLILASTSKYRQILLARLGLSFTQESPDYEEILNPDLSPEENARQLAIGKASSLGHHHNSIIIGSDQIAHIGNQTFGKPGTIENATEQLKHCSNRWLTFSTGLAVLNSQTGDIESAVEKFEVKFKPLSDAMIRSYLERDTPYDCAGSIKAESLGVALFAKTKGSDINTLYGLPLIRLVTMLESVGIDPLKS